MPQVSIGVSIQVITLFQVVFCVCVLVDRMGCDMESPPDGLERSLISQDPDAMRQSFLESFISRTQRKTAVVVVNGSGHIVVGS